jgi:hypothetical protein
MVLMLVAELHTDSLPTEEDRRESEELNVFIVELLFRRDRI